MVKDTKSPLTQAKRTLKVQCTLYILTPGLLLGFFLWGRGGAGGGGGGGEMGSYYTCMWVYGHEVGAKETHSLPYHLV